MNEGSCLPWFEIAFFFDLYVYVTFFVDFNVYLYISVYFFSACLSEVVISCRFAIIDVLFTECQNNAYEWLM